MALRHPIHLDVDTLIAHAEYNEMSFPHKDEIVEKAVERHSGVARSKPQDWMPTRRLARTVTFSNTL